MKTIFITIAFMFTSLAFTLGQSPQNESRTEFSLEIDPATFVFSGYGVHFRVKPKNSDHLLLGIGAYAMDFPDLLVDLNANNKGKGWDVRLGQGWGIFGEYHFSEVHRKWFVGTQIGVQKYRIKNTSLVGEENYTNSLVMGYAGYTWPIFGDRLYLKPWAGIGYTAKIAGSNTLEQIEYAIAPLTMFATLHLGYRF
ncbi:MAG: hypothetical protein R2824_15060 [Saprospiraceae bacterium]|nr:hypothetical protein [Lewinella sp.]